MERIKIPEPQREGELIFCPVCRVAFFNLEDYEAHYRSWHVKGGIYYLVCPYCMKKFESERSYLEHIKKCRTPSEKEKKETFFELV